MRVLILLPPFEVSDTQLERALSSCRWRFGPLARVQLAARAADANAHAALAGQREVLRAEDLDTAAFDAFVAWRRTRHVPPDFWLPDALADKAFVLEPEARLRPLLNGLAPQEDAARASHLFSRKAPVDADGQFGFFPYGYLYLLEGLGPVDAFGYRIQADPAELARRPGEHKLVAVFGGSSTWSLHCLPEETFCSRLERSLNAAARQRGLDARFTVLNFGLPGNVVLNQTVSYLLHAQHLRPDIVIGHDGINDFFYGLLTDEYLLRERGITYPVNLEQWPDLLHHPDAGPTVVRRVEFHELNLPHLVLKEYVRRKRQFMDLVTGNGAFAVWGLQPSAISKMALDPEERLALDQVKSHAYAVVYENLRHLYELFPQFVGPKDQNLLNFHELFRQAGADQRLFTDYAHTTPQGDEVIAAGYADFLVNHWPGLAGRS